MAGLGLPALSTFDAMASSVRSEVNASICAGIHGRMSAVERAMMPRLLEERDSNGTTPFNRLKKSAQGPSWSHFKRLFTHPEWPPASAARSGYAPYPPSILSTAPVT